MTPRLILHCQHSLGLGHLVRSLVLARSLAERFDVVLLAGGELPSELELPPQVEVVRLPALAADLGGLVSRDDRVALDTAHRRRAELVLETFRRVRPDVVVVELFPFGRKKFARELLPMVSEAAALGALVVCSLRDILVRGRSDQPEHDERAARIANRFFDAVLVHADPRLVRLEETFRPRTPLRVPVHYTGLVAPQRDLPPAPELRTGPLVVSAGGGRFGGPLLRAAAAAQPAIRARTGLAVRLVAGPFLPDDEWRDLARDAYGCDGLDLVRTVPDLASELVSARASLSQCGYNTALDLLRSRVPALVAPFAAPGEDEQSRRAGLLAEVGAVRVLHTRELVPATLAEVVRETVGQMPAPVDLDIDGARRTRDLLSGLVAERRRGAA
jgi:predicted glycosyltransferase